MNKDCFLLRYYYSNPVSIQYIICRAVATKKKLVRSKYKECERRTTVSLAKQDKPCTARPFSSWGSGEGGGGAVNPQAGSGAEPQKLLKISHFPITKLTDFD